MVPSSQHQSEKVAVIRGGSIATKLEEHAELTYRNTMFVPSTRDFWIGFRCASNTPPAAK
jgi:formylglycine-generating enzyme required for sulfatase activity